MTADPRHITHPIASPMQQELQVTRLEADARSQLAKAEMLLAETRLHCAQRIDQARVEADAIIREARTSAQRIIAEAQARHTGVDTRPRSSASFSELWAAADQDHDIDSFFLTIPQRSAKEVFSA